MKRVLLSVFTGLVILGLCDAAAAALCEKCRGKTYIMSIGKCTSCGGHTSSGAFKLCKKCSAEQGKCQHCLAPLDGARHGDRKPPREDKPPKPEPIDPNKSKQYSFADWEYQLEVKHPGTRSEGKWGRLLYKKNPAPDAQINDYYRTPWGRIYWVDDRKSPFGDHGWMPYPSPREPNKKGRLLPPPEAATQQTQLTKADDGKTVVVTMGNSLTISLKGNITTGYSWRTVEVTGEAVEQDGEPRYTTRPHAPGMVGVGGTFVFKFKALKPGKATIKLGYARPWEKDKPPAETFSITVKVQAR